MIRWVETAEFPPAECAITKLTNGPFIDTGVNFRTRDGRIYLKIEAVVQLAEEAKIFEPWKELVDEKTREITRLQEELQEADKLIEAAEVAFTGFQKHNKIPVSVGHYPYETDE